MRIVRKIILCTLLAAPLAQAQELRFDAMEKDFGDMRPLERRSLQFTVYNESGETVRLAEPKPSCGCTATFLDRSDLAPGDSAILSVSFHAAPGMMGEVNKSIAMHVREEGGDRPIGRLRVHARVVGDVIYEPGMLQFSAVRGDTVQLELTLRSNTDHPLRIENYSAALLAYVDTTEGNKYHVERVQTRPFTAFDLRFPVQEIAPGGEVKMYMTLRPHEKGQINGTIRIPIPDGELRVPVVGVVLWARAP